MKIFNRGTDAKDGAAQTAATTTAPAAGVGAKPASPALAASAPAVEAPAVPAAPDLAVILDANVKEMSEKIARLASSLESSQEERTGFEAKIEQMEDRMRKLSSLTEMISAQYNPFVGDAPSERGEMPRPEIGLAPPAMPSPAALTLPPPQAPASEPQLSLALAPPDFGTLPPLDALPAPEPLGAADPAPSTFDGAPPMDTTHEFAPMAAMSAFPTTQEGETTHAPEPGIYLWMCPPGFESSMLLLGWSDMLLKSAGSRESLLDLVNYYHNIGWIGDPARDQLLAYADGLIAPTPAEMPDWRTNVEVHEKSLLFVEKLRAIASRRHP